MCLILFGYQPESDLPLLVAANRDEFHARASAPAAFWRDHPQVLAGRDLVAGGTWLGCTRTGRFAALTNFADPSDPPAINSRGELVSSFLTGHDSAEHYAHHLQGRTYAGFNLLLFDGDQLIYTSNKSATQILQPGFYGLSNAELGAQWPKCVQGAAGLNRISSGAYDAQDLLSLLADSTIPPDDALPHRGRPVETERRIAPCFINGSEYGTRASTVIKLGRQDLLFVERSYDSNADVIGEARFELDIESSDE